MHALSIIGTHPDTDGSVSGDLVRCIEECFNCAQICISCADACSGEHDPKALRQCIRLDLDCADVPYTQFTVQMNFLIIFFAAIVAPQLVSRDLRAGTLPLYFSRPLRAADYVIAKYAAMVSAVWLLLGVPQFIMFLGGAFTTKDGFKGVWNELGDLLPGWGFSLLCALMFAGISLLVASLTGKQAFAAGGIVAVFLVTTPIVGVLSSLPSATANQLAYLASPPFLLIAVGQWMGGDFEIELGRFGPVYGIEAVSLIVACLLILLARYRKVASL